MHQARLFCCLLLFLFQRVEVQFVFLVLEEAADVLMMTPNDHRAQENHAAPDHGVERRGQQDKGGQGNCRSNRADGDVMCHRDQKKENRKGRQRLQREDEEQAAKAAEKEAELIVDQPEIPVSAENMADDEEIELLEIEVSEDNGDDI